MSVLRNNETFAGDYVVRYFIKEGSCAETYRISDRDDRSYFLKIFDLERVPSSRLTEQGVPFEVEACARLSHPVLAACRRTGVETLRGRRYAYLVTDYIQGGLLAELLGREHRLSVPRAVEITRRVLDGVKYLHEQSDTLIHNDLTARNIMYETANDGSLNPRIIDMGHLSHPVMGRPDFQTSDLEMNYRAPETFLGIYTCASDLFSVGVLLYEMIYGCSPWTVDVSEPLEEAADALRAARKAGLVFPDNEPSDMTDALRDVLRRALAFSDRDRFDDAQAFINALEDKESEPKPFFPDVSQFESQQSASKPEGGGSAPDGESPRAEFVRGEGKGFEDVAGMEELKQLLRVRVINVLRDKERAERYRLSIPNGMLLYGPPGCGKTFIAEKFAEETGFNYTLVKASDLASIYVHGSQQMIGKLFDEARRKAPAILCFDEFDALVPNRSDANQSSGQSGEVNEFLSQLNNCGKKGVFVIATSNRPDKIDPAVLRTGRIDRMIYVPLPDLEARQALFEINLKGRPTEGVDCAALAARTENYVASDIAYVVNDAAVTAAFANVPITQKILCETLDCIRPSVSAEVLHDYEVMREKMTGLERRAARTPIGYKR